jgi:hypothetical protein
VKDRRQSEARYTTCTDMEVGLPTVPYTGHGRTHTANVQVTARARPAGQPPKLSGYGYGTAPYTAVYGDTVKHIYNDTEKTTQGTGTSKIGRYS